MIFRQLYEIETGTCTYLLADSRCKEAVIIDPVLEMVDRDARIIRELNLKLLWILDTHVHADHITGASALRERFSDSKVGLSRNSGVDCADRFLREGEEVRFGNHSLHVVETPGHTDSCLSFYNPSGYGMVFSGDALLVRACGRTDFQQGDSAKLFHSVKNKLFRMPASTLVFPGHNYDGALSSSIGEERVHNTRLKDEIDLEAFQIIMNELKLDAPKQIERAVPANLKCGQV